MPKKGHTQAAVAVWQAEADAAGAPPTGSGPWMKMKEACTYLKVGRDLIDEGIQTHRLTYMRVGGRKDFRFRQSWLDDFAESFAVHAR